MHNIVEFNIGFDYFYHNPEGKGKLRLLVFRQLWKPPYLSEP